MIPNSQQVDCRGIKDLSGYRFGNLTVIRLAAHIEYTEKQLTSNDTKWYCKCDCGEPLVVIRGNLITGHTTSCGCKRKGQLRPGSLGKSTGNKRIKNIWESMHARCYNVNHTGYKNYGSKGIQVCDEWRNNFEGFKQWALANGYADHLTIDRIDPTKHYHPDNCRWITQLEQQSNKQNNITCPSGLSLRAECHARGLNYGTVRMRYKNGYSIEEALDPKPIQNKFYYNGKTMEEWCAMISINLDKVKTRMCRHQVSFKDSLIYYISKAQDFDMVEWIQRNIPNEKDTDRKYPKPRLAQDYNPKY